MSDVLNILKRNQSPTPSKWREEAIYRKENKEWLRVSQYFALFVLGKMDEQKITQKALALELNVSQQYISKILKGRENLSIETIVKILKAVHASPISVLSFILNRLSDQELASLMTEARDIKRKRLSSENDRFHPLSS